MSGIRVRVRARAWVLGPLAFASMAMLAVAALGSSAARAADPVGGSGTDTSLPMTPSAVTVNGRGRFADMQFTVNQTASLGNQAISITWSGGAPTAVVGAAPGANYVQIMQCWGDDDGAVPENPGPPPEQCVQGAQWPTFGAGVLAGYAATRTISRKDFPGYDPLVGYTDDNTPTPASALVWRPFRAVDGTVINNQTDPNFNGAIGGDFWLNLYFNNITTNEIFAGRTDRRGHGAELFEVHTGIESSGLGCGQRRQPVEGGDRKIPRCWLVIVPRGEPADENVGAPAAAAVATSPLTPAAWANRIAVPLEFNPVESSCDISDQARRIAGTELAQPAVVNWQPALCSRGELPPYAYAKSTDSLARQQLTKPTPGSPGMVVVSRPVATSQVSAANPIMYAPLAVTGIVIGFNIERRVNLGDTAVPEAEKELQTVRVAHLNLTPRLVAKLLSQSYTSQNPFNLAPAEWQTSNPTDLGQDPDFLAFNPEFAYFLRMRTPMGGLALPSGNSDAARQVWAWVLSDPEAKAWLDGEPDPWGMQVNPAYRTRVEAPALPFGDPLPESFPKNDPTCYQAPPLEKVVPPAICGADWVPYVDGFQLAARAARAGTLGAKTDLNTQAETATDAWKREQPPLPGEKALLAITDVASATKYGIQMASLSRAGDNGPERTFVPPGAATLAAGVDAMEPGENPAVLEPVPGKDAPGAYPLTALLYAAAAPLSLDKHERHDYAAFLDYAAAGAGQEQGVEPGKLPPGYVPLPDSLRAQSALTAKALLDASLGPQHPVFTPPETTVPATSAPPTSSTSTAAPATDAPTSTSTTQPRRSGGTTTTTRAPSTTTTTAAPTAPPDDSTTVPTTVATAAPPEPEEPPPPGATPATPVLALARSRYAVPGLGVMALGSGLGALEITKRPRRPSPRKPPIAPIGGS